MSRPTKFEDLSTYDQQGLKVASFAPSLFLSLPRKTLIRVLKALESLDVSVADGLLDKEGSIDDGEDVVYRLRPTEEDRARKLRGAQLDWDRTKEWYEEAQVDPASVPDWKHWSIKQWAKEEGKPAIDWENGQ